MTRAGRADARTVIHKRTGRREVARREPPVTVAEILDDWPDGLTFAELTVLVALAIDFPRGGPMSVSLDRLARQVRRGRGTTKNTLTALVRRGLLERLEPGTYVLRRPARERWEPAP